MLKKITRRLKTLILELENMFIRWAGNVPSHYFRRFIYRLGGMKIGKGSTLHTGIKLYNAHNIKIGEDTIVGEGTVLDGRDSLIIGNHVDIASEVMIYNAEHDVNDPSFKAVNAAVNIGDYVFIGPRAIILPGITLNKGAVVGAGAVVTKDVPEFTIVGGVPAKIINERNKEVSYLLGRAAWFR